MLVSKLFYPTLLLYHPQFGSSFGRGNPLGLEALFESILSLSFSHFLWVAVAFTLIISFPLPDVIMLRSLCHQAEASDHSEGLA